MDVSIQSHVDATTLLISEENLPSCWVISYCIMDIASESRSFSEAPGRILVGGAGAGLKPVQLQDWVIQFACQRARTLGAGHQIEEEW